MQFHRMTIRWAGVGNKDKWVGFGREPLVEMR